MCSVRVRCLLDDLLGLRRPRRLHPDGVLYGLEERHLRSDALDRRGGEVPRQMADCSVELGCALLNS